MLLAVACFQMKEEEEEEEEGGRLERMELLSWF
jgi:hypothetical protein